MKKQLNRRVFIENTVKGMTATGLMAGASYSTPEKQILNSFSSIMCSSGSGSR